jgi:protocatechuate 3,4-dioxygenase alpha subunit
MAKGQTPSQTVGPYFAYGLVAEQYGYPHTQIATGTIAGEGERIAITGRIIDGKGEAVSDAMIEVWLPEAGFGRVGTGTAKDLSFTFNTVKPPRRSEFEAPSITAIVFMRGLLSHLFTRIYFEDEAEANASDNVLNSVPQPRRTTLIAKREGPGQYRFDIHLQGEHETVFFDL